MVHPFSGSRIKKVTRIASDTKIWISRQVVRNAVTYVDFLSQLSCQRAHLLVANYRSLLEAKKECRKTASMPFQRRGIPFFRRVTPKSCGRGLIIEGEECWTHWNIVCKILLYKRGQKRTIGQSFTHLYFFDNLVLVRLCQTLNVGLFQDIGKEKCIACVFGSS